MNDNWVVKLWIGMQDGLWFRKCPPTLCTRGKCPDSIDDIALAQRFVSRAEAEECARVLAWTMPGVIRAEAVRSAL